MTGCRKETFKHEGQRSHIEQVMALPKLTCAENDYNEAIKSERSLIVQIDEKSRAQDLPPFLNLPGSLIVINRLIGHGSLAYGHSFSALLW